MTQDDLVKQARSLQQEVAGFRNEVRADSLEKTRLLRRLTMLTAVGGVMAVGVGITAFQGRTASRENHKILASLDPKSPLQESIRVDGAERVRKVNCLTLFVNGYDPKNCEDVRAELTKMGIVLR